MKNAKNKLSDYSGRNGGKSSQQGTHAPTAIVVGRKLLSSAACKHHGKVNNRRVPDELETEKSVRRPAVVTNSFRRIPFFFLWSNLRYETRFLRQRSCLSLILFSHSTIIIFQYKNQSQQKNKRNSTEASNATKQMIGKGHARNHAQKQRHGESERRIGVWEREQQDMFIVTVHIGVAMPLCKNVQILHDLSWELAAIAIVSSHGNVGDNAFTSCNRCQWRRRRRAQNGTIVVRWRSTGWALSFRIQFMQRIHWMNLIRGV